MRLCGATHTTAQPGNHIDSAQLLCLYTVAQRTDLYRILHLQRKEKKQARRPALLGPSKACATGSSPASSEELSGVQGIDEARSLTFPTWNPEVFVSKVLSYGKFEDSM